MKSYYKYSILTILAITITMGVVFAFPAPIGTTVQSAPFDSQPTAWAKLPSVVGWSVGTPASAFDGDDLTSTVLKVTATTVTTPARLTFTGFTTPANPQFTADWVDIKVLYEVPV